MATFKKVWTALRAARKPGIVSGFPSTAGNQADFQALQENQNGDPLCDVFGSQWVRDAGAPQAYASSQTATQVSGSSMSPYKQVWNTFADEPIVWLTDFNKTGAEGRPVAIYHIQVFGGDPAVAWNVAPLYFQLFRPFINGNPLPALKPDFCIPVPRETGVAYEFGVPTPFNGTDAAVESGGVIMAFSTTPFVYTAPVGLVGAFINVNFALYSVLVT